MRNVILFVALIFVAIIAYQVFAPMLVEQGIDMNLTAVEDTNVETH